jgi:hypothetical protein
VAIVGLCMTPAVLPRKRLPETKVTSIFANYVQGLVFLIFAIFLIVRVCFINVSLNL